MDNPLDPGPHRIMCMPSGHAHLSLFHAVLVLQYSPAFLSFVSHIPETTQLGENLCGFITMREPLVI